MKKSYDILTDRPQITETEAETEINIYEGQNVNYREYKKAIRNLQIHFEHSFSELKENIDTFENGIQQKQDHDIYMFTINNKQKLDDLENIYENGVNTLNLMKSYFGKAHNSTYVAEITRYCGIFEKFKIQLQNIKNTFDKTYLSYIVGYKGRSYRTKEESTLNNCNVDGINGNTHQHTVGASVGSNKPNNNINYVFKERNALEFSLNELDNMITQGEKTTAKLKNQNFNIMQQIKKVTLIDQYMPQIQKVLKKIKYYNVKKSIILAAVITLCIFFFFLFT